MRQRPFYSAVVLALITLTPILAIASGPQTRPGKVIGPIVGVGRSQPLTPEQAAQERKDQIKGLLVQYEGDDETLRGSAAAQLAQIGQEALPLVKEAAAAKGLGDEVKRRYKVLLAAMQADAKSRAVVEKHLKEHGPQGGELTPVVDETLQAAFPDVVFYVLRYRQFPIAYEIPEGMKSSNIFAVKPDGSVVHLPATRETTEFFQALLPAVKDEPSVKSAVRAWLRISQEWRQDGFYRLVIPADSVVVDRGDKELRVTAKAVAQGGGNSGEIVASLTFTAEGKLASATGEGQLRPGIRPICQATKLLDSDPVVRAMARQSLLVMGRNAREYLAEQRVKASPQLQEAIDETWRTIVEESR